MGRNPREARKTITLWFKSDPEWRTEEREDAMFGENITDLSLKENLARLFGSQSCYQRSPIQDKPAFESLPSLLLGKSSLWEICPPLKCGSEYQNIASEFLSELCFLQLQSWEGYVHGCCGPHFASPTHVCKGKLLHGSQSSLFLREILNNINNLNFE